MIDDKLGVELNKAVKKVSKEGYEIGIKHYKRIPRGFDPNQKNSEYLLYNGLTAMLEQKTDKVFYSKDILTTTFMHYKKMKPIHNWLCKALS